MDCYTKIDAKTCYIGKTRFSAGIFLSPQIAKRKIYSKRLTLTAYADWEHALISFLEQYGDNLTETTIKPNTLYNVLPRNIYSVFSTAFYVGITYSENAYENIQKILPDTYADVYWKHNLTYDEAIEYARGRFVKIWQDPNLYICQNFRVHIPISLSQVKGTNQINTLSGGDTYGNTKEITHHQ